MSEHTDKVLKELGQTPGFRDHVNKTLFGGDYIIRQAAIEAIQKHFNPENEEMEPQLAAVLAGVGVVLGHMPSTEPEIIRCKDCRWWDKYGNYDNGYCMAAKHGYWSEHWEIRIRRTYKGDFYCADAEPKGEQE